MKKIKRFFKKPPLRAIIFALAIGIFFLPNKDRANYVGSFVYYGGFVVFVGGAIYTRRRSKALDKKLDRTDERIALLGKENMKWRVRAEEYAERLRNLGFPVKE